MESEQDKIKKKEIEDEVILFAETNYRSKRQKFGIRTDDRRRHMYIVGKTGVGKSTVLENMIYQDIIAGHGVAIVDPHGDLAEKALEFIPANRINDTVYFNPADYEFPFAFNVLERVETGERHLVASGLIGIFKKIWADSWGPRLEYVLRNAILALLEYPGSTLLGIMRILVDKEFRGKVVDQLSDPVVKSFWLDEYPKYPDRLRSEAIAPIQNKVGQFLSTALIRNIVGQIKSKIDLRQLMDEKKILIMNLSKGRIGEDASSLLGAMMITKIQLAAMSRINIPEIDRHDFYLYVDEFQNFATDSFANILSEARKYHLNLVIAHQYIGQLATETSSKVRDAVFGNVGTMVIFRVGAEDAEFLAKEFAPRFEETDLVDLDKYNIYVKLMIDGITSEPFSAATLPPLSILEDNKEKIIKVSRERYTEPRKQVEEKIMRWSGVLAAGQSLSQESNVDKYEAVCNGCGKTVFVPFVPDGIRPIYCKDCLKKNRQVFQPQSQPRNNVSFNEAIKRGPIPFKK
ncbi:MAG: type IV secretion system DNA-binding domain-containing protein [Patescibacteria group bacterium]|nr:type IV secretion system DNA-binding domain-containing protein [Patescibacteria group bacterium]